jgi:hypothetical protein
MISIQNTQMVQFFASITERMSQPDLDLATIRDVYYDGLASRCTALASNFTEWIEY